MKFTKEARKAAEEWSKQAYEAHRGLSMDEEIQELLEQLSKHHKRQAG